MKRDFLKKYIALSELSYVYHACATVISYIAGIIIGNLLAVPFLTGTGVLIFIIGGAVMAFPLMLIILIILPLLKRKIEINLREWCLLAPIVVVVSWLILEWSTNYSNRMDPFEYLSVKNVWERALLALLCSGSGAIVYFCLIKQGLVNKERALRTTNLLQTKIKQ